MLPSIEKHGLLPTSALLRLFAVPESARAGIEQQRRPRPVECQHPIHGKIIITDNLPLSEKALAACLEDGLSAEDWLLMLNARVFFWPDEDSMRNHLAARFNRNKKRLLLEFDTLTLAEAHGERLQLAPFNTGSTLRKPARRGLSTFTPMKLHSYPAWRKLRGGRDRLKEVAVVGGMPDARRFIIASHELASG